MRVIPGMTVIVPADDVEARAVTRAAYECDGLCTCACPSGLAGH